MRSALTRTLIAAALLSLAACSSSLIGLKSRDPLLVLTGLDATHTFEVREKDSEDEAAAGYLVEFYKGSAGTFDERDWPAGTVLIQNRHLQPVGFITPGATAFRFDDKEGSVELATKGRHAQISMLLGLSGELVIRSALPGVELPPEAKN